MSNSELTPAQIFQARKLLGWKRRDLAKLTALKWQCIRDFEVSSRVSADLDLEVVRGALDSAGVIFVNEDGKGPGVRLRKSK